LPPCTETILRPPRVGTRSEEHGLAHDRNHLLSTQQDPSFPPGQYAPVRDIMEPYAPLNLPYRWTYEGRSPQPSGQTLR